MTQLVWDFLFVVPRCWLAAEPRFRFSSELCKLLAKVAGDGWFWREQPMFREKCLAEERAVQGRNGRQGARERVTQL